MTSVLLSGNGGPQDADSYCIDAAGMIGTTNYVPVRLAGYGGMSGYIAGKYAIARSHLEAWWEMGGWWMLNYERSATAGLGGAATGNSYAADCLLRLDDLGHLGETAVIFSFADFSVTADQFDVLDDCHHAMIDRMRAGGVMGGAYGPPYYLRHLAVQPWWPAEAPLWQWGGAGSPEWWTTVKQYIRPTKDVSGIPFTVDENYVWRPMKVWTGYGADPEATGDDVRYFVQNIETFPAFVDDWGLSQRGPNPDGSWPAGWLVFDILAGGKQHVTGAEWSALTTQNDGSRSLSPQVGFIEYWTTGRIQTMPNVLHPPVNVTVPPPTYGEDFAQAVIAAGARLLADEAIVLDTPALAVLRAHFERA